ncbi:MULTISPECIES: uroporphyrinogen-III synthase [unclassified Sphingomonas]|uniref:uroporphyrinogen-III synthase n=1 Tax=unclassified Sphingomonas TaxID=196159 RepID=UPI00070040FF|nr:MULTISPECIES: uroporphyrinogen-III synthase [unclassified Sphingomonas]KQX17915.1 uroporphyrinogen III synthase HEM4 [Sphingomonas sp. Root1294]KQY70840.1 uroporphyrinogen III synthase HEM4 [Sphingomonas sp. Root50]KRB91665.1 uroporphyrinogen III synthase HEM4 [Sphingomonas sp. Root720]
MSRAPLLILRPEPGASMTAKRAFDQGWRPIVSPIFRIEPIAWGSPPATDYDALFVTSANAVRQAGKAVTPYAVIPAYAVGDATARALKAAGFTDIRTGRGDAAMMLEAAAENGVARALHLAGEDYRDVGHDAIAIDRRIVYRSAAIDRFGEKALAALREGGGAVLLHSGRAAEHFGRLCDEAKIARRHVRIAALAPAVLAAAGTGWRAEIAADKPDDAALLAAAARLCQ